MDAEEAYRKIREQAGMRPEIRDRIAERARKLADLPD